MTAVPPTVLPHTCGAEYAAPPDDARHWEDVTLSGAEPDQFRAVMRQHAKGVAIITAGAQTPAGFCATSLTSVSLKPPLVSFTVGLTSSSWVTVKAARHVMAHLLADSQEDLARAFAQQGGAKFGAGTRWHRGALDLPVLDDVLARLVLAPVSHLIAGDHALVISRVLAARLVAEGRPLLHHNGRFAGLAAHAQ